MTNQHMDSRPGEDGKRSSADQSDDRRQQISDDDSMSAEDLATARLGHTGGSRFFQRMVKLWASTWYGRSFRFDGT